MTAGLRQRTARIVLAMAVAAWAGLPGAASANDSGAHATPTPPASSSPAASPSGPKPGAAGQPEGNRRAKLADPLSMIEGSPDAWTVSQTPAGCFLMSPRRKGSSRLAVGRHPAYGLGLFAVGFALAMAWDATEPVVVQAGGRDVQKAAQMVAASLLFVPLDPAEAAASLQELQTAGALWLGVRNTWISHGGQALQAAIAEYRRACDAGG